MTQEHADTAKVKIFEPRFFESISRHLPIFMLNHDEVKSCHEKKMQSTCNLEVDDEKHRVKYSADLCMIKTVVNKLSKQLLMNRPVYE